MKTGPKKRDRSGERFGRWTVVSEAPNRGRHTYWLCKCDCGEERVVGTATLTNGESKSCGCLQREGGAASSNYRHGGIRHPLYYIWVGMRSRCRNPRLKSYANYGGRGITVCERWMRFENFRDDMLPTWSAGLSIDRIDNNGNYEPSNCRWATQAEQLQNVRHNVNIETSLGLLSIGEASRRFGIDRGTLANRYRKGVRGDALFSAPRKGRPLVY